MDKLFTSFISSPPVSLPKAPKKIFFQAYLQQSTVSVLQAVETDNSLREALTKHELGKSKGSLLALLSASLVGGTCNGVFSNSDFTVNAAYTGAYMGLRISKTPLRPSTPYLPAGELSARNSSISLRKGDPEGYCISPTIGDVLFRLPGWSPSVLVQTVTTFAGSYLPLGNQVKLTQQHLSLQKKRALYELLQASATTTLPDPSSAQVQVSFMVNSGTPGALRAHLDYAALTRMRAIRHLSIDTTPQVNTLEQTNQDLEHLVKSYLIDIAEHKLIDWQEEDITGSLVYKQLYAIQDSSPSSRQPFPMNFIFGLRHILMEVGEIGEPQNQVELGPCDLHVQVAERTFTKSIPLSANKSSTSLPPLESDQPVTHVILSGTVGQFRITLHPSLLGVIQGGLQFTKRPSGKQMPASPTGSKAEDAKSMFFTPRMYFVESFVNLELFEVRALTQVLSVGIKLKGARLTVSSLMGGIAGSRTLRGASYPSTSILAGFHEFSVQARSMEEGSNVTSIDRSILAAVTFLDGEMYTSVNADDLRGTLSLRSLKLTVPRSAMKLYTFMKQWEAEYLP